MPYNVLSGGGQRRTKQDTAKSVGKKRRELPADDDAVLLETEAVGMLNDVSLFDELIVISKI